MSRKGFARFGDLRGLLALGSNDDAPARERGAYVTALRSASSADYGPW